MSYSRKVLWLILIATTVKLILAAMLELGVDEVYYWNFVLFPAWSYFDHPLMVGIVGKIFSLNKVLTDDFFLRLGPVCLSAASTWVIFLIGKKIKDERTGFFAALLFTGSIYTSIIAGFSYIPDAPLVLFWLLALLLTLDFLPNTTITRAERIKMLLFGVCAGLAMLSKYQGAFLWVSVFIYVVLYNRQWLKEIVFWLSGIISAILILPIFFWNLQNNFISFNYHSERVTPSWKFRIDYFLTETFGQLGYQNPIIYVLIVIALVAFFRKKHAFIPGNYARVLLWQAAPVWLVFTSFSLFRSTLPHWSGPAFISLMVIAAAYWAEKNTRKSFAWVRSGVLFLALLLAAALWLINFSPLQLGKTSEIKTFGEDDFTQDMYGWEQINQAFKKVAEREEQSGTMPARTDLISHKMFPAAHLDYYVAQPNQRKVFAIGALDEIHMYAWIDEELGGPKTGKDYYHVALSNLYQDPNVIFGKYFEKIEPMDTVKIVRAGVPVRYALFYRLRKYNGGFVNPVARQQ